MVLTSISSRLRMWIPACRPLSTRLVLGVSMRTMVLTECSVSITQSSTRTALSTTSHTTVEMEAAEMESCDPAVEECLPVGAELYLGL